MARITLWIHAFDAFFISAIKKGRGREKVELKGKSAYAPRIRFHSHFLKGHAKGLGQQGGQPQKADEPDNVGDGCEEN